MTILEGLYWLQEALRLVVEVESRLADAGATANSGFAANLAEVAANPFEVAANLVKVAANLAVVVSSYYFY